MASKTVIRRETRKRTFGASLVFFIIKLLMGRKMKATASFTNPERKSDAYRVPRKLAHDFDVDTVSLDHRVVHTLAPRNGVKDGKHIVYLHGGYYIHQPQKPHWWFAEEVLKETGARFTLVEYPLAPENNHHDTVQHVVKVTENLREKFPDDELILSGDSAGGGLSIALVQELLSNNKPQPFTKLALICPWLDPTRLDWMPPAAVKDELILSVEGGKLAAEAYAGPDSIAHPHVAPLKGGFDGFPEVAVWMGGRELFFSELELFLQKLEAAKVDYHAYVAKEMVHVYPILGIPESHWAINQYGHFIRS